MKKKATKNKSAGKISKRIREEMYQLYRQGYSALKISEKVGVGSWSVKKYRALDNWESRKAKEEKLPAVDGVRESIRTTIQKEIDKELGIIKDNYIEHTEILQAIIQKMATKILKDDKKKYTIAELKIAIELHTLLSRVPDNLKESRLTSIKGEVVPSSREGEDIKKLDSEKRMQIYKMFNDYSKDKQDIEDVEPKEIKE